MAGKFVRVDVEVQAFNNTDPGNATKDSKEQEAESGQPLGQLSKQQILKADKVLDRIEALLTTPPNASTKPQILSASAEYYSYVPHDFGLSAPPPIDTDKMLGAEKALLQFYLRMGFEGVEKDDEKKLAPIAGVMDLPLAKTLAEAAAGCCSSSVISGCVTKGAIMADRNAGKPLKPMSPDLYGSILLYTGNAIYRELNQVLRDEDRTRVKKFFGYLRMLLEACSRLPVKECTLWRGIGVDLFDQYQVGSTITWWAVSSCTSDQKVAQDFANSCGSGSTFLTVGLLKMGCVDSH